MATTTLFVEFDIKPGHLDAFKAAAAALFAKTQEEPDTLRYDYFLAADGTRNVNVEVFKDADAFVFHNRNVADLVPALFSNTENLRISVMGDVNADLWAELADIETAHYEYLGGISR